MLGLASSLAKGGASLLTYVKDNLKLYLDFKSNKSDTLKFPCEGSTDFGSSASNYYINLGTGASLRGQTSGSICGWINASNLTSYHAIITEWNNSGIDNWGLWTSGQNLHFDDGGGTACTATTDALSLNTWHHVCVTKDGTTITLYVDGVQEKQITNGAASVDNNGTGTVFIGIKENLSDDFLGKIANIGMWHRALSVEEINSVMRKSYSQLGSVEKTSLVMWQSLDSASNGVVQPETGEISSEKFGFASNDWNNFGSSLISQSGGTISYTGSGVDNASINYEGNTFGSFAFETGKLYKLVFTISSATQGKFKMQTSTSATIFLHSTNYSSGTYTFYIRALSSYNGQGITLRGEYTGGNFDITSISWKEVTSNTGVVTGATTTTSVYGGNVPVLPRVVDVAKEGEAEKIGNGSLTTSSGGYADLGNDSVIQFGGSFSVSCWFKTTDTTATNEYLLSKYNGGDDAGFALLLDSNRKINFWYAQRGSNDSGGLSYTTIVDSGSAINDGEWYHLSAVFTSGSKVELFKNGISIGSSTSNVGNLASHVPNLFIASQDASNKRPLDGSFAQVGLWQGALTQAQIQSVMESTSYSKIPSSVKSTLGSELVTSFTNFSSQYEIFTTSGNTITNADNTSGGTAYAYSNEVGASTDKIYKIVVQGTISGTVRLRSGQSDGTWTVGDFKTGYSNYSALVSGTNTYYVTFSATDRDFLWLETEDSSSFTNGSISVKEVTNDIVGYWGLDADNAVDVIDLDGAADYMDCGTGTATLFGNGYNSGLTVAMWVNASQVNVEDGLFNMGSFSNANGEVRIYLDDESSGKLKFKTGSPATTTETAYLSDQVDKWNHIVCVYDGSNSTQYLYLNGSLVDSASINSTLDLDGLKTIIGGYYNTGATFNGQIASTAVYNTAYSASDVLTAYNNKINKDLSSDSNLVGYWKGTSDLSSNSNNGTLVNDASVIQNGAVVDSTSNQNNGVLK